MEDLRHVLTVHVLHVLKTLFLESMPVQVSLSQCDHHLPHRHSRDWRDFPNLAGDFPSRSTDCVKHQVDWSRLRWNHWFWLRHRWTFTGSRFLTSLWHGALLSDRITKKIAEVAPRVHRETHYVEQTKNAWNFLWSECQQVGFFGVTVFNFFLWTSSWWQLHCHQKCTTETRLEKNVCWWVPYPHLTIAQPLVFSFQLGFEFCFFWWDGLLSSTSKSPCASLPVLQSCLLNVALQSPFPKSREQAVHPCAIQHPKKWFQIMENCGILTFASCTSN